MNNIYNNKLLNFNFKKMKYILNKFYKNNITMFLHLYINISYFFSLIFF